MSKTIAINAGSSSLKWQLYQMPEETVVAKGIVHMMKSLVLVTVSFMEEKTSRILL